jgi:hypothetical protein
MSTRNSRLTHLLAILVLITGVLGCGRFNSSSDQSSAANTGNGTGRAPNPPASQSPAAPTEKKRPAEPDIAGGYNVTGTNIEGQGNYQGGLTITQRGEVLQFSWDVAGSKYDGVGVRMDDAVAVSYAAGANGKGCGAVLYRINSDGSLDGRAGYWGVNESESEKAVRISGSNVVGDYEVTGTSPDGTAYENKLAITASGPGFIFKWTGANALEGVGIRQGNFVTAGFGGKQCSFVAYQINADGSLDGSWGGVGTVNFGTEKAVKK